jgi:hypothetical protein
LTVIAPARPPEPGELEALIEEARRRARRRRRRHGAVLVLAALTLSASYAFLGRAAQEAADPHTPGPTSPAAAQPSRVGPYWYTRRVALTRVPAWIAPTLTYRGQKSRPVWVDVRLSDETWIGVDGTMRDRQVVVSWFATPSDRARWRASGMPPLPKFGSDADGLNIGDGLFPPQPQFYAVARHVGDGLFTYRQLLSLPTRAGALRARISHAEVAFLRRGIDATVLPGRRHAEIVARKLAAASKGDGFTIFELSTIGELLASPIPVRTRLALFHAAATIPGVINTAHVHDSLGRPAVAVTASGARFSPVRLLLDPATGVLLGGTSLSERFGPDGTVIAQGSVDSIRALPHGVTAIMAPGTPPEPQKPIISPAIGRLRTVFNVTLRAPTGTRTSGSAPPFYALVSGPAGRGCRSFYTWPSFARLSPATPTWNAGRASYVYRLTPPSSDARTWCAGRFKLELVAGVLGHPPADTSGIGSSTYFQVR